MSNDISKCNRLILEFSFGSFIYTCAAVKVQFVAAAKSIGEFNKEMRQITGMMSTLTYSLERVEERHKEQYNLISPEFLKMKTHVVIDLYDPVPNEILETHGGSPKGLMCCLFDVKDAKYTRALTVAANPHLFGLVVDNLTESLNIVNRWKMAYSTPIIPNEMPRTVMPQEVRHMAVQLVGEQNVVHALDCITYDPSNANTMQLVFGGTFICKDVDTAVKVSR